MLYGLYGLGLNRTVEDQICAFELGEYRDVKFENLSTGLKQRLSLAKAMLNHPRLLFLDEPTTGLDPDMSAKTHDLIRRIHDEEGISVIMSTHYMPEAELLCDRIAFLRKGEVAALDTPQNLKNHLELGKRVRITYRGLANLDALRALGGVLAVRGKSGIMDDQIDREVARPVDRQLDGQADKQLEISMDSNEDSLDRILKGFQDAKILDINIEEPDLEDVFLELAR
jgi:ABC-2 type transport system ATP-binding protein